MGALSFFGSPAAPLTATIDNAAASGDVTVVAAAGTANRHRIYGLRLTVAGATIVTVKSGAGITLERINFGGAGGGIVLDLRELPYWTCNPNQGIVINSSAAVQVDGTVEYTTAKA